MEAKNVVISKAYSEQRRTREANIRFSESDAHGVSGERSENQSGQLVR